MSLLTLSLLVAAGCMRGGPARAPARPTVAAVGDYVGNEACAECHPEEFRSHRATRHATTMHMASRSGMGDFAPPDGPIPLAGYSIEDRAAGFTLSRQYPSADSQAVQYALGSGKLGITFITILSADSLMETRMSYFPHWHLWDITPGQEQKQPGDETFGRPHSGKEARGCLGCHTTTLPHERLVVASPFLGVGCEACHGPGREHIAAIRAGAHDIHMERIGDWPTRRINDLCGRCHRTVSNIDVESPEADQTQRFQPVALLRSRCRTAKNEPLSCLTCHDPHTDASTDHRTYEVACLHCHATSTPAGAKSTARKAHVCPVNARGGCITCHMPPVQVFPGLAIRAAMTDHLITLPSKRKLKPMDVAMDSAVDSGQGRP